MFIRGNGAIIGALIMEQLSGRLHWVVDGAYVGVLLFEDPLQGTVIGIGSAVLSKTIVNFIRREAICSEG